MRKRPQNKKISLLSPFIIALAIIIGGLIGLRGNIHHSVYVGNYNSNITSKLRKLFIPQKEVKVPILVYHYVEYVKDQRDVIRKSLSTQPHILEAQIKTLKDNGYTFITFERLDKYLEGEVPLPKKAVILTFDDGYEDFYTDVLPILKKYKVFATQYLITGFIGKSNYMTDAQVKEVIKSGYVEVGAHSVHHYNLKSLTDSQAYEEILNSKTELEKKYQIKISTFAYPYGHYNEATPHLVKKAGFSTAVTVEDGFIVAANDRYTLFRIHPGIDIGESLIKKL